MPDKSMEPENKEIENKVEDETTLDAELEKSINEVKAGKTLEATPEKTEGTNTEPEKKEESPTDSKPDDAPTGEDASKPLMPGEKDDKGEFRIPNKGKFESDEAYETRIKLFDLVKRRKAADTPEKKAQLSEEIKKTKGDLKVLNGTDKINNQFNQKVENPKPGEEEDPAIKADRERLKQLGGATKEDIQEEIRQERLAQDIQSTLDRFVERHPEFKDDDVRDVFFDFVETNFNWNGKAGKELMTVLELARESMFKPSETVEERVLKGANVAEKVKSMSFPGGGGGPKPGLSSDMNKSLEELKATGMSEEKALELLAD
jgi:hypothetical protein